MQSHQVDPQRKTDWVPAFRKICLSRKKPHHWLRAAGPLQIHCGAQRSLQLPAGEDGRTLQIDDL